MYNSLGSWRTLQPRRLLYAPGAISVHGKFASTVPGGHIAILLFHIVLSFQNARTSPSPPLSLYAHTHIDIDTHIDIFNL